MLFVKFDDTIHATILSAIILFAFILLFNKALIESAQRHIAHEIDPDRVPESVAEDPVYTVESSSDDESWTQNEGL